MIIRSQRIKRGLAGEWLRVNQLVKLHEIALIIPRFLLLLVLLPLRNGFHQTLFDEIAFDHWRRIFYKAREAFPGRLLIIFPLNFQLYCQFVIIGYQPVVLD